MDVLLVSESPEYPDLEITVGDEPVIVGRSAHATVQISHPLVSRLHCEFRLNCGQLFVRDLASTNQTFVNDRAIETTELHPGDRVLVGGVCFQVRYESDSSLPVVSDDWAYANSERQS